MSEIVPSLWLGGAGEARELSPGMAMVVNCTDDQPFWNPAARNFRLSVRDTGEVQESVKLYNMLSDDVLFETIEATLNAGQHVLVHCRAGQQRSAAVVACYLVWKAGVDPFHAMSMVRAKRPEAFFGGANFIDTITHYAKSCG